MPFLFILAGYLIGSIPFGLIVARYFKVDIRKYGSGNIGATNVLRTLGPVPGGIVFTLDMLKGTASVVLPLFFGLDPLIIILCGLAAVLGHSFPLYLGFKGGKGVATSMGVLLGIAPDLCLFTIILFAVIVALTRFVSVGSMLTAITITIAFFLLDKPLAYSLVALLITIIIILRHRPNIRRLLVGTEPRIGEKK